MYTALRAHARLPSGPRAPAFRLASPRPAAAADDLLIELHYKPVPNAQIAIWIEDKDGKHVQDVFLTQATGKLGIGNRPGIWNFVGSWRAPYGPRLSVLPIWANRRAHPYPKVVFYDKVPGDEQSLGWHENTSSAENYYCRPLTRPSRPQPSKAHADRRTGSPWVGRRSRTRISLSPSLLQEQAASGTTAAASSPAVAGNGRAHPRHTVPSLRPAPRR